MISIKTDIRCETCGAIHRKVGTGPGVIRELAVDGWRMLNGKDTCPECVKREPNAMISDLLSHLVAAVSLLKRGSKKAAPSNKMFDTMVSDYEKSIERGRTYLKEHPCPSTTK